jgi:hypothetical protein
VLFGVLVALAFCYQRRRRSADDDTLAKPYPISSFWSTSPGLFGKRPRLTAEDGVMRKVREVQRAPGRRPEVRSRSPPTATASDPILEELQRLREELTAERRRLEAPPSYDSPS